MKTTNLQMEMMVPMQWHKDIVFNESLLKIDSFMNVSINSFIDDVPAQMGIYDKYIIARGENKNNICYKPLDSKPISLQIPKAGMIIFLLKDKCFYLFDGIQWQRISQMQSKIEFTPIAGDFVTSSNIQNYYLYLNASANLHIEDILFPEITIIIKQYDSDVFSLTWSDNILWENQLLHIMTNRINAIDIIKLYKLPETDHFLGKIIGQDFNY